MTYRIECYDGSTHPASEPYLTATATTERAARRAAAQMLGYQSLRGASMWDNLSGDTVYQFGPRVEDNGYDYVVIVDEREERERAREDYD